MYTGKAVVIGAGFVGSTVAYTLTEGGLFSEIAIIDVNKNKAEGDAMDISHGISFLSPLKVTAGDYEACRDADIIIITAGAAQKPGESRTDLLHRNFEIFQSIIGNVMKYCRWDVVFLVVTNPVDILTYATYKLSGLSKNQVIGSGTVLDTSRLKYMIGEHVGVDVRDINTYIIGEHGDSEVAAWSLTSIAGQTLDKYCARCRGCEGLSIKSMHEEVVQAAYRIIEKKGATYYAIAMAVRRIVKSIVRDEHSILTVSTLLDGEYDLDRLCLSVPSVVGRGGVSSVLDVQLSDTEYKDLVKSAQTMKNLIKEIGL